MTGLALSVYVAFLAVALGWRTWLQYRRTGDHGFRGFSGRIGSIEWLGGALFVLGMALAAGGPVADLFGLVEPWRVMRKPWPDAAGLLLGLLGFGVTIVAQLQMRDSWRVGVSERETTRLVTAGLFSMVRNPIFTGMLLLAAGLFCMVPNILSLAAFMISLVGVEIQVRRVEEPYLIRIHGEPYLSYARAVGRFVPWVGRLA